MSHGANRNDKSSLPLKSSRRDAALKLRLSRIPDAGGMIAGMTFRISRAGDELPAHASEAWPLGHAFVST